MDASRDAGSIPAASTNTPLAIRRKWRFFMDLRHFLTRFLAAKIINLLIIRGSFF
jgi:hypothetical protein